MATTSLIVEVLVIGAVSLSAFILVLTGLTSDVNREDLLSAGQLGRELAASLAVPMLALTYAVGWIANFCSERIFKALFQQRLRGSVFKTDSSYEHARFLLLQHGSAELVHEVSIDRHIIRLGRAGVFNFSLLALGFTAYGLRGWRSAYLAALFSLALAVLSYMQWRTRYLSHYKRVQRIAEMLGASRGSAEVAGAT